MARQNITKLCTETQKCSQYLYINSDNILLAYFKSYLYYTLCVRLSITTTLESRVKTSSHSYI